MASISDLLIAQGNAAANARSARGNIYADLIRNLSSLPGQVIQQQRSAQQDALRQQALTQQLELGRGEQSIQQQRLAQGQAEFDVQQKERARKSAVQGVFGADIYDDKGDIDEDKIRKLVQAGPDPTLLPDVLAQTATLNELRSKARKTKAEAANIARDSDNEAIGEAGLGLFNRARNGDVDEGSYQVTVRHLLESGIIDKPQADQWLTAGTPQDRLAGVNEMIGRSEKAMARLPKPPTPKTAEHDPTKVLVDEATGKVIIPATGEAKPETRSLQIQAGDALKRGDTAEYKRLLKVIAETGRADDKPSTANDKLTRVEHKDPATGETVIEYLPASALKGQTFQKGTSATVASRLASATAVNQVGNDIISRLQNPDYAKVVGPALGRFSTLQDFIGNPPPEFAELAGSIESYALANMGVHGMRSVQGAEKINQLLNKRHTPASLIATIKGLNEFSTHFLENEGRKVPQPAPPPAAKTGKVGKYTYTVE